LSTFLRGSSIHSTGVFILPCLKEPNKIKNEVWFYVLIIISSKSMAFFDHQNKGRPALRVEVSCLCNGDSNLDHVPLKSSAVPRLPGTHQKTITLHSHGKTGDVVRRWGMWGNCILMRPEFLFCIMTGIDYISPSKETFNCDQKFEWVLNGSHCCDHSEGRGGIYISPFRKK
jgi:hypothetical protein